jgi:hypothetical protein
MQAKLLLTPGVLGIALSLVIAGCGTTTSHISNAHPSHTVTASKTPKVTPTPSFSTNVSQTPSDVPTVAGNAAATTGIKAIFTQTPAFVVDRGVAKVVSIVSHPAVGEVSAYETITLSGQFYAPKSHACQPGLLPSVNGQPSQYGPAPKTAKTDVYGTLVITEPTASGFSSHPEGTMKNPTGATITYNCQ